MSYDRHSSNKSNKMGAIYDEEDNSISGNKEVGDYE
jgi:hypothetical protein